MKLWSYNFYILLGLTFNVVRKRNVFSEYSSIPCKTVKENQPQGRYRSLCFFKWNH